MNKKFISAILALLMLLSLTVIPSFAEEDLTVTLVSPTGVVGIHTQLQADYLAGGYNKISGFADGTAELSRPLPVTFSWTDTEERSSYILEIAEDESFENSLTYSVKGLSADIYNLKIATDYYYRVDSASGEPLSETGLFVTDSVTPRNLYISGVTNARDLGGYVTERGNLVKQGMIYRTAAVGSVTEKGKNEMKNVLGVRSEIDLRLSGEILSESPLGSDINYYPCPMDYHGTFLEKRDEDNPASLKKVFEILSDESNYPVFFHCSIGTDRTGFVAYTINGLLGVKEENLFRDYLYSNFGKIGGSRDVAGISAKYPMIYKLYHGSNLSEKIYNYLHEVIGVPTEQLDEVIRINTQYSSIDGPVIDPAPCADCNHMCHATGGLEAVIWKIVRFFYKLFNINRVCECGALHY